MCFLLFHVVSGAEHAVKSRENKADNSGQQGQSSARHVLQSVKMIVNIVKSLSTSL